MRRVSRRRGPCVVGGEESCPVGGCRAWKILCCRWLPREGAFRRGKMTASGMLDRAPIGEPSGAVVIDCSRRD